LDLFFVKPTTGNNMIFYQLIDTQSPRNYMAVPDSMRRVQNADGAASLLLNFLGFLQNYSLAYRIREEMNLLNRRVQANITGTNGVLIIVQIRVSYPQGVSAMAEMGFVSAFIAGTGSSAREVIADWNSRPQMTSGTSPLNPFHGGGEFIRNVYFWCTDY
jgi:hypothetical protein